MQKLLDTKELRVAVWLQSMWLEGEAKQKEKQRIIMTLSQIPQTQILLL